jgi:Secretion system C-terminal sorting domain
VLSTNFSPTQGSQWKNARVNLTGFKGQKIFIRFRSENGNGNNLFMDNINIFTTNFVPTGLSDIELNQMNVYPNPSDGNYTLEFNSFGRKKVTYTIYNATGQIVKQKELIIDAGNTKMGLNISEQVSGVYMLEINDGKSNKKMKLTKY